MITKNDWNDAFDAWVEEERERLGGPPSPEEVVAYVSGELSGAAAARVRALLVYYPELTPLLDERIETPRRAVLRRFPLRAYAVAATIAIAILLFDRAPRDEPAIPTSHHEFNALRARGSATPPVYELPGGQQQRYLITVVPSEPPSGDEHVIEITHGSEVLWTRSGVRPVYGTFIIDVPGEFLKPGTYRLNLDHRGQRLESYTFRVTLRPRHHPSRNRVSPAS